jgi:hypothetical protein
MHLLKKGKGRVTDFLLTFRPHRGIVPLKWIASNKIGGK